MAAPGRELSYGTVQIYTEEDYDTLGIGSYGKVCKAKCGQLPCAAKLLHETMFGTNDPGILKFVERFNQECQFLRAIKHPNIVQFLGTLRDPRSRRLALLMELMDESLTRFLARSTGPLPYHTQLNICHDVALALAYLHSNDIIHRDLSSNNVLLICEGSRAKVTDFGMSMLEDMNPRMTPLTTCPGTAAYMPPEALITPPRYSSKLDCFSYGVLTIQIVTRQFPNPGDANQYIRDPRFPTGRVLVQFPETERRKKDIYLVAPDHPLLPLALHCLKDWDTERPSADELCGRLATLKREPRYTQSMEQSREYLQTLQQQVSEKDEALERARQQNQDIAGQLRSQHQQTQEKERELERARQQNQDIAEQLRSQQQQTQEKERELEGARQQNRDIAGQLKSQQQQMQEKERELERARQQNQDIAGQLRSQQQQTQEKERELEGARQQNQDMSQQQQIKEKERELERARKQNQDNHVTFQRLLQKKHKEFERVREKAQQELDAKEAMICKLHNLLQEQELSQQKKAEIMPEDNKLVRLTWRQGTQIPTSAMQAFGAAVVHVNTAYFSKDHNVYSYSLSENKWTTLPPCEYECFSLAVVSHRLTTIGGWKDDNHATDTLLSILTDLNWKQLFPSMPTERVLPAAVTTTTHLVVAGGRTEYFLQYDTLSTVEVLDLNILQWSSASSSPQALQCPHMTLCGGYMYLSQHNTIFSCSMEELLKSCKPSSTNSSDCDSVWTRLTDIPVPHGASLATLRGHVLAIGGDEDVTTQQEPTNSPTGAIHCYDRNTNSWIVIGEMPTPRSCPLVAVLPVPRNELIVVGGSNQDANRFLDTTEIAYMIL